MVWAAKPQVCVTWPFTEEVCQPFLEQIKGWMPLAHRSVEWSACRTCREATLVFYQGGGFSWQSRHRCPVCLETKFVPRPPPQSSGGRFSEQPVHGAPAAHARVHKDGGAGSIGPA